MLDGEYRKKREKRGPSGEVVTKKRFMCLTIDVSTFVADPHSFQTWVSRKIYQIKLLKPSIVSERTPRTTSFLYYRKPEIFLC